MMPYAIYAPDYQNNSAGVRVLYKLAYELGNLPGVFSSIVHPGEKSLWDDEAIAVYPEGIKGNPLNARCVVRWVLNAPGLFGGARRFHESEQVFIYSRMLLPYVDNKVSGILYLNTVDLKLFKPGRPDRTQPLIYQGKYIHPDESFQPPKDAKILTRNWPPTREEVAELLKSATYVVTYDGFTAIIDEARCCGTPVVVAAKDYDLSAYTFGETGRYGLIMSSAVKDGHIPLEQLTAGCYLTRGRIEGIQAGLSAALGRFVEQTQEVFSAKNQSGTPAHQA